MVTMTITAVDVVSAPTPSRLEDLACAIHARADLGTPHVAPRILARALGYCLDDSLPNSAVPGAVIDGRTLRYRRGAAPEIGASVLWAVGVEELRRAHGPARARGERLALVLALALPLDEALRLRRLDVLTLGVLVALQPHLPVDMLAARLAEIDRGMAAQTSFGA
jgi:hypothetical protein